MAKIIGIESKRRKQSVRRKIRYAVVGLGYISQIAVLPAFEHASENSELSALVSSEPKKLKEISRKYGVANTYSYDEYDECLESGEVDAVYIALPNHMHREYTERAVRAGVHVLCEKPMAVTEAECESMIQAAQENRVKLMIAYRLHFEPANLAAIELVNSGKIGHPKIFNSTFTEQVKEGDIRLNARKLGGGTLYDIGIYCINAARYLFQEEPERVVAVSGSSKEPRFRQAEENTSATLCFSHGKLATFTCSFGASSVSAYEVVGTEGSVRLDPAYEYAAELKHEVKIGEKKNQRVFPKHDQFAPELIYFSDCILNNKDPEPSGWEGLADVRIIRALYRSAETGKPVDLPRFEHRKRPSTAQRITRPPVRKPKLVNAESPSGS
jgi:predicted dehydrogenase